MAETQGHICLGFTDEPYPKGTHICYLYNDEDERRQILPLFAQQALADGDAFHYVADVPTPDELPRTLAALDLTQAFKGPPEQIAAATVKEGYFPDGSFEPDAMLARLRAAYDQCKVAGLNSARFAGEMTWALRNFPADKLKIDRSFIHEVETVRSAAAVMLAVISFARTLGMRVIAEGVETVGQAQFLRHRGCDEIQGYLVARPLPPEQFIELRRRPEPIPWDAPAS